MRKLRVALLILLAVSCLGCGPDSRAPAGRTHEVTYRVSLSPAGRTLITYTNVQGGIEQVEAQVPWYGWEKTFAARRGEIVSLVVASQEERGRLEAVILLDGQPWKSAQSSGAYVWASCSGIIGRDE